jgi:hypothetical protein
LINQLIEKEMREQTEQQNKKLREIKERTAAIRKRYEEQQKRSSGYGSLYFTPETYGQGSHFSNNNKSNIPILLHFLFYFLFLLSFFVSNL